MVRNPERFSQITSGIQNIAVIVAIIGSAIWAVATFGLTQWEDRTRQANAGLSLSVEAKEENIPGTEGHGIVAIARITNRASKPRPVNFDGADLIVQKLTFVEG